MSSDNTSDSEADTYNWEVQDILAERTVKGSREFLVMWKPTWVALDQMDSDGPVYQAWRCTPKMVKTILIRFEGPATPSQPTVTAHKTATSPEETAHQCKQSKTEH